MQVTVAKTAGFCFGVRRALALTQKSAALSPTCTLGELIHNRQVVEELAGQGVTVIERPEDAPAGTAVVIRSHGVGPQVYDTLRAQGSPVIDATCPFVKRIHQIAAEVPEDGLLLLAGAESIRRCRASWGTAGGRLWSSLRRRKCRNYWHSCHRMAISPSFWRLRPHFLCANGRKYYFSQKKCVQI